MPLDITANEVFVYIIAPLTVASIIAGFTILYRKLRCIDTINSRTERQNTAMILVAKRQDEITEALHPDSPIKSNLGELCEDALRENNNSISKTQL